MQQLEIVIYIKNKTRINKGPIKRIVKRIIVKRIYINKVAILIHQRIFILSVNNRLNKQLSTIKLNIYNVWLIINDYRNNY